MSIRRNDQLIRYSPLTTVASTPKTMIRTMPVAMIATFGFRRTGTYHTLVISGLHVTAGVMWIGLLWYFNFVQTPSMPKIPDEHKPAVSKVIAPTALFWFRWGAMYTFLFGVALFIWDFFRIRPNFEVIADGDGTADLLGLMLSSQSERDGRQPVPER